MTKNPFINAGAAMFYIILIVSVIRFGVGQIEANDTIFAPIAMISLFTLSAAIMGYLFLYESFQLYFNGARKEALKLFLQTVATFAAITLAIFIALFSGIL